MQIKHIPSVLERINMQILHSIKSFTCKDSELRK